MLVMAKAPVPGQVKTRLGATVGQAYAAELAHAALLDTLAVCEQVFGAGRRLIALTGDVAQGVDPESMRAALRGWRVFPQEGGDLGVRIAAAHRTAHALAAGPVVQIGMDTPHLTTGHLSAVVAAARGGRPVLGRAHDGGWWVLATQSAGDVDGLGEVTMSAPDTWESTHAAVSRATRAPVATDELGDVDTEQDAVRTAALAPTTRFARIWNRGPLVAARSAGESS